MTNRHKEIIAPLLKFIFKQDINKAKLISLHLTRIFIAFYLKQINLKYKNDFQLFQ